MGCDLRITNGGIIACRQLEAGMALHRVVDCEVNAMENENGNGNGMGMGIENGISLGESKHLNI